MVNLNSAKNTHLCYDLTKKLVKSRHGFDDRPYKSTKIVRPYDNQTQELSTQIASSRSFNGFND